MSEKSLLDDATSLSEDVLKDLELGRLTNYQILLKCRRLARLVNDDNWTKWLDLELHGYNVFHQGISNEELRWYFSFFGRELNTTKHTGLVHPLATLEQEIATAKIALEACRVPSSIQASSAQTIIPDSATGVVNSILFKATQLGTTNRKSQTFGDVMLAQIDYLGKRLDTINEETSKGVHSVVQKREADSTVLLTYLVLSDLVDLVPSPRKADAPQI